MPYYEVVLTARKAFCIKAGSESEAEALAMEQDTGDFDPVEASVAHTLDEQKSRAIIAEYKAEGSYVDAE